MDNNDIDSGSGLISSQSFTDVNHRDLINYSKGENKLANEEFIKLTQIKEEQAAQKELEN